MKFQRWFFSGIAACAVMLLGFSTTASATISGAGCVMQGTSNVVPGTNPGPNPQYAPLTSTNLTNFLSQCAAAATAVGGTVLGNFTFHPATDNIGILDPSFGVNSPSGVLATNSGNAASPGGGAAPIACVAGAPDGCNLNPASNGVANTASATARSTWYLFQYSLGTALSGTMITISHDDGISLYINGALQTPTNQTTLQAANPTVEENSNYTLTAAAGSTVDLIWDECCSLPSELNINLPGEAAVPEPASILLLGTMLVCSSLVWRRRQVKG